MNFGSVVANRAHCGQSASDQRLVRLRSACSPGVSVAVVSAAVRRAAAVALNCRWPEALAASDRAMSKAYGPRQFLLYNTRADILLGMGDRARARAVLQEALDKAEAMPEGQRSRRTIEAFRKRLAGRPSEREGHQPAE